MGVDDFVVWLWFFFSCVCESGSTFRCEEKSVWRYYVFFYFLSLCVCVCFFCACVCSILSGHVKWRGWLCFRPCADPLPAPSPVFMGLVSTGLPFNLRYRRKIRCVVLPAHSKWTVYERISNLHKVLNQISSCPWNKYCRTSWDIHWEKGLLKDAYVDIIPGCHLGWSVALCHAVLNLSGPAEQNTRFTFAYVLFLIRCEVNSASEFSIWLSSVAYFPC